jgi:hypothetical protein
MADVCVPPVQLNKADRHINEIIGLSASKACISHFLAARFANLVNKIENTPPRETAPIRSGGLNNARLFMH